MVLWSKQAKTIALAELYITERTVPREKKLRPGPPEEPENTDLIADCREKGWKTCCSLSRLDDAVPEARNSVIIT